MEEKSSPRKRGETYNLHFLKRKSSADKNLKYAHIKVTINTFIENINKNFDFQDFSKENLDKLEPVSI